MRENKFRGKDAVSGMWVYGYYVVLISELGETVEAIWQLGAKRAVPIDIKTLGQFTGLHDKNGNEIYEMDIVKRGDGSIGYVAFLPQECGYVIVLKNSDRRLGHRNGIEGHHLENIGNIYKNPELLEVDN